MTDSFRYQAPSRLTPETHQRRADKLSRIPIKVVPADTIKPKPNWIRAKAPSGPKIARLKRTLRENNLTTVCEEAACPNLGECFNHGTATFMIMGDICTRRCPFCDVAHGRPKALDPNEPMRLAHTVRQMGLTYVVVTSVDRDDLKDGGAAHFVECIRALRNLCSEIRIEILVPDFRGRLDKALKVLSNSPPDVFNHNVETVPRLYKQVRPGADYGHSLKLLCDFKKQHPKKLTKSGLMLGLGESFDEVEVVMKNLRDHGCDMVTLGQYLQPSQAHLPVVSYVDPASFEALGDLGTKMGFSHVASGPMVRSSYHADRQAERASTNN